MTAPVPNVIDTTENCRYCLMCRHLCPVGHVTSNEALSPHGWAQTVASERRGLLQWSRKTVDNLYQCADCGNCESHCVTDQPLPNAIAAVRSSLAGTEFVPQAVSELASRLDSTEHLYNGTEVTDPYPAGLTTDAATGLFVGDEIEYFSSGTLTHILKLLGAAGSVPVLIGRGRNDSVIPSGLGLTAQARSLAEKTRDEIVHSGIKRLLVLSPGARFAFTRVWPERLGVSFPEEVHIVELLEEFDHLVEHGSLKLHRRILQNTVAYADPEHAVRFPDRFDTPRRLLGRFLEGTITELFWRGSRSGSTGHNGLRFTHPELASSLAARRLQDAQAAGVTDLITEDAGTMDILARSAGDYGITVHNFYDVLAGQLAP